MAPPMHAEKRKRKRIQGVEVMNPSKRSQEVASFKKRVSTLKRKAKELSILCDLSVCAVCYGPDGELHTWPEDKREAIDAIFEIKRRARCEKRLDLFSFFETKKKKLGKKEGKAMGREMEKMIESWNDKVQLGLVDEKELVGFDSYLENKLKLLEERRMVLEKEAEEVRKKNKKKGKALFNDDRVNGKSSLTSPCEFAAYETSESDVNYTQYSNPPNVVESALDHHLPTETTMLLDGGSKLADSYVPLGYETDMTACSSISGILTGFLGVGHSCSDIGYGMPRNFDFIGYGHNNLPMGMIHDNKNMFLNNGESSQKTVGGSNVPSAKPVEFNLMGFNNNYTTVEDYGFMMGGFYNSSIPTLDYVQKKLGCKFQQRF